MTRKYEATHPWLTFKVDFSRTGNYLWLLLGEAQSKCQHIEGVPLQPETARVLQKLYLAKGARASAAIEGNTLSEEQAIRLAEGESLDLPPSQEYLEKELDNILDAANQIVADLEAGVPSQLSTELIYDFNRRVLKGLDLGDGVVPGEIREGSVAVGQYVGAPATDCEYLLDRLCEWLNGPDFVPSKEHTAEVGIVYAVLKAVVGHLYLAWIHPFADGNGRTARLLEVQVLAAAGVPLPAAHLLSNHYNETRAEYYRRLDRSSQVEDGVMDFVAYAVKGLVDQLRLQLRHIREQQWRVAWINHVHEVLRDEKGITGKRRRDLVLELSRHDDPVPKTQLPGMSPALLTAYVDKTDKTLTRDLNFLRKKRLIKRVPGGYKARSDTILAFLPWKAPLETSEE